ncbi:hypothetical protein ACP4OV_022791 [Aristida adscensionis]
MRFTSASRHFPPPLAAAMAATSGDSGAVGGEDSACSTPFVSAPSSPARDAPFSSGCFYSAPASPARGGAPGAGEEYGGEFGLDFDFDFSSRFPSPAAVAMSSADELFHNGQIRPMRLASFLLRPQAPPPPPLAGEPVGHPPELPAPAPASADERGRLRCRSVHRRARSLSPLRAHWLSPSPASSPVPAASPGAPAAEAAPSASRSSSSSSTSSSSSSSRGSRRWGFLKGLLLHRSKSDGGKHQPPPPSAAPPPKRSPSPAAGRSRRSAHARLYEARRAEAEEMRRRTSLPYRQGLLFGCLGLNARGHGAMHGLVAAAAAAGGKSRA